jgi:hypothetical protein
MKRGLIDSGVVTAAPRADLKAAHEERLLNRGLQPSPPRQEDTRGAGMTHQART